MSASVLQEWPRCISIIVLCSLLLVLRSQAAEPVLDVVIDGNTRHFSRDALLARPDAVSIELADSVYGKTMRYRAIPVAALLAGRDLPAVGVRVVPAGSIALASFSRKLSAWSSGTGGGITP